jgi:hypothetical protein
MDDVPPLLSDDMLAAWEERLDEMFSPGKHGWKLRWSTTVKADTSTLPRMKGVNIALPRDRIGQIAAIADDNDLTFADVVRFVLCEFLVAVSDEPPEDIRLGFYAKHLQQHLYVARSWRT